jgi:hypothetical protein
MIRLIFIVRAERRRRQRAFVPIYMALNRLATPVSLALAPSLEGPKPLCRSSLVKAWWR